MRARLLPSAIGKRNAYLAMAAFAQAPSKRSLTI